MCSGCGSRVLTGEKSDLKEVRALQAEDGNVPAPPKTTYKLKNHF